MDWSKLKTWLIALITAIVGGAATVITSMIEDPSNFNFHLGEGRLLAMMLEGALVALIAFLVATLKDLKGENGGIVGPVKPLVKR